MFLTDEMKAYYYIHFLDENTKAQVYLYFLPDCKFLGDRIWYCCSVAKSCPILCDPVDCSIPGFPVFHYLLEFTQTHVP